MGGGSVPLITFYLLKQQNKTKTAKKQTKHTKKNIFTISTSTKQGIYLGIFSQYDTDC